jgi:SAM-dependent methyltransferase
MKDYSKESRRIRELVKRHKKSRGTALLDVACGTGRHLSFLRKSFKAEGLDADAKMLGIARKRNPGVRFHKGNMVDFHLPSKFDVITCLFSAIGYVKTLSRFRAAISSMAKHLKPGGMLIVEPWLTPQAFKRRHVGAVFVNQPKLKIARINIVKLKGRVSTMVFHYLIGTPEGISYFTEPHKLGLFTRNEYLAAFRDCELKVAYYSKGLIGRGLYVGMKPRKT